MGVDIQKDRIECSVWGWGTRMRRFLVEHLVIFGEVEKDQTTWNQLDTQINRIYHREDGLKMPIRLSCVDSGAFTQLVYQFCMKYQPSRVRAIKGMETGDALVSGTPTKVAVSPSGRKIGYTKLWKLNVNKLKEDLYSALRVERHEDAEEDPRNYCRFPNVSEDFFLGLTSEEVAAKRDPRTFKMKYVWRIKLAGKQRNEILDCANYARAAAFMLGLDRMADEQVLALAPKLMEMGGPGMNQPKAAKRKTPRKGGGGFGGESYF